MERGIDLAQLRARVRAIEGAAPAAGEVASVGGLDAVLPWGGLPRGALHEIAGRGEASGFAAVLLARLARDTVVWCQTRMSERERGRPYGPGLAALGLDPARLILVRVRREREALMAMEESLRAGVTALGEIGALDLLASRRLQLAAEAGGAAGLLLRPAKEARGTSAALTRFKVTPHRAGDGGADDAPMWCVTLLRCRGGMPGSWTVRADESLRLAVPALLADRPAAARRAG